MTERERYKFEEASSDIINFKMINENASEVSEREGGREGGRVEEGEREGGREW